MDRDSYTIRNATITNSNFSGEVKSPKDREGKRYLIVKLDPEDADELRDVGWNVKITNPKENSQYEPYPYIKVNIVDRFYFQGRKKRSKINLVTNNNIIAVDLLDKDLVETLEESFFEKVDITMRHIYYKTYDQWSIVLDTGYFTIEPDDPLYGEYHPNMSGPIMDDDDEEDNPFM